VRGALAQLRERLPPRVGIWAGGRCPALHRPRRARSQTEEPPFWPMSRLEDIPVAVARWRAG
jgi:hypothetical protein